MKKSPFLHWLGILAACVSLFPFSGNLYSEPFDITAASWLGGTDSGYAVGSRILSDGRIVIAANIGDSQPGQLTPTLLGDATTASSGALVFLSADGKTVLNVSRIAPDIWDLDIDSTDKIYVAAGEAGLLKIEPTGSSLLWTREAGEFVYRVDSAPAGTVGVLKKTRTNIETSTGSVSIYSSAGDLLGGFGGMNYTQDVAVDETNQFAIIIGYTQANSGCNPVQIAYMKAHNFEGTEIWRDYNWPATWLDDCDGDDWTNLMADTRGYRLTIGDDGLLYAGFESAGGNHIISRLATKDEDGTNLRTPTTVVGGDMWHSWYNTRSEHKVVFGRYDPATGEALLVQQFCTRFYDGNRYNGNAARIKDGDIWADADGRVYLASASASGLPFEFTPGWSPKAGETTFNPFSQEVYWGGAYLLIMSPDFTTREYCTRLSGGTTRGVHARKLSGESQSRIVWAGDVGTINTTWGTTVPAGEATAVREALLYTSQPFQASTGGGGNEGFVAVIGGEAAAPAAPEIQLEPVSITVNEGAVAQFTVVATGNPLPSFQWFRGSDPIPGGDSNGLTFTATMEMDGTTYFVKITNEEGLAESKIVTVDVIPDVTPPTVTGVSVLASNEIHITFSEPVKNTTGTNGALNPANYQLNNGATIKSVVIDSAKTRAILTTSLLSDGLTYTLTVKQIADASAAGNILSPNSLHDILYLDFPGVKVNFQPSSEVVPDGYVADSGEIFGDRGNGFSYGWDVVTGDTRKRNANSDQRYDTINHMAKSSLKTWEVAVPNGRYSIFLVAGDPSNKDQTSNFLVEGVALTDPDGQDNFDTFTIEVTVNDGRITIVPSTSSNQKIAFVDIAALPPALEPESTILNIHSNSSGGFHFAFESKSGQLYQLETATDLKDSLWLPIGDVIAGDGSVKTVDRDNPGEVKVFYRLVITIQE